MRTLLALVLAVPLLAQPVTQKIDVRVVNVDVSVVDGSGAAVADLTGNDFEISEDGQPQQITNFALYTTRSRGAAARPVSELQTRRRVILLVDNNYIDKT